MLQVKALVMPPELPVLVSEGNIAHPEQPGPGHPPVLRLVNLVETLIPAIRAHGDDHAAPGGELVNKVLRELSSGGPDMDGVIGARLRDSLPPVTSHQPDPARLQQRLLTVLHNTSLLEDEH